MKIKQVIAGGLAAVAALATIGFSALGAVTLDQGLEPFVAVTDTTLTSPAIVIGSSAGDPVGYPKDVAGAGDIAASMVSNYATVEKTTPGVTTTSVSGGALVSTESTKLYGGDNIGKSGLRTTLTSANLPTMLASGTFSDDGGTTYKYNQYINLNPTTTATIGLVSYGNSGGDLEDPTAYLATGSSTSTPLFNMTVVFNRMLNISHTDVQGNTITLFGKTYTIGSNSDFTATTKKLELFGGAEAKTIKEGEKVTVTVEGTDYEVEVIGVSTSTIAAISVDGVSKEVTQGNSYTISGLDVYVDTVFYLPKETQVSSVKMSFGTAKLILQDGQTVKVGQNEDTIDGTMVNLVGSANTGISKISLGVTAKDSSVDHIAVDGAFTDPIFEAVKLAYGGATGGTTDQITIDNSGTTAATLKFTDYWGNEKTITWAYTGSSSFAPQLNWSSTKKYHVVEGETVRRNEYILLAPSQQSDFGHIFQYTSASSIGSSGAYIELKDVMSGDTNRIYLTDTGYASATFYVDGQPYYVKNVSTSGQTFNFTWGAGASAGVAGNAVMVYPLIKAKGGEWITLVTNVTLTTGTTYELPTNSSFAYTYTGSAQNNQFGRVWYYVGTDNVTTIATATGTPLGWPGVLVLEENAKDTSTPEVDVKDAIITTIADGTGSGVDVTIQRPTMTEAIGVASWTTWTSDNSVQSGVDRRGTYIKYDSDSQGLAEITYSDEQATAAVAVGSDPVFTMTTTAGGTYKEAVPVTNPVVKLDNEVDTTALTQDLILVGGPCANTLVKTLLDTAWNVSDSCSGWDLTSGNGLIKVVEDAFGSGQKALIVAGTDADDTRNLIGNYVIKPTKMATLTGAEYKGAVA